MKQRALQSHLLQCLKDFPVVYVNGPRQAGKTTLMNWLKTHLSFCQFVTFDDPLERAAALRHPHGYLAGLKKPLIIDEVQMVPALFREIKRQVDIARQSALEAGKRVNGMYVLTGSANLSALPDLSNAMVGRMVTLTLPPLSACESMGRPSNFLHHCFNQRFDDMLPDDQPLTKMMKMSSFPEIVLGDSRIIDHWFKQYIHQITYEDPRHIYQLAKSHILPLLLQSLSARSGSLVNVASLGREVGLNAVTTRQYCSLFDQTFVTHTLRPWHQHMIKRLVKSSKVYFHDTMLLCHLLGDTPQGLSKLHPHRFGHVLENFVLSELYKASCSKGNLVDIYFYRTQDGQEVDFILHKQNKFVAIEVKHAEHITDKDLRGIRLFQSQVGDALQCSIILCNTTRVIEFEPRIFLLPFSALWQ
jgi:predicted AAA+ superfamily ATPase